MTGNVLTSRKRLLVVLIVLVTLIVLLMVRVGYWNIARGEWLQEEAQGQWISDSVVVAKRGSILDRNKNVLAQSASADTVVLLPQNIKEPDAVADALFQILGISRNEIYYKAVTKVRLNDDGTETKIGEVWLKRQVTSEQSAQIEELKLKGVKLISDVKRYYPNKDFASQVIGYTTMDGEGQTGTERRYDNVLEGRQGRMVAETDKYNNDIPNGQEMFIEPMDGKNVMLTLDEVMQSFLETECKDAYANTGAESVQGVIMDVENNEVLAMSNIPEFDLNEPPRTDGEVLMAQSANIVTAGAYEPGGIFAAFTGAAAKDSNTAQATYICTGAATMDGQEIICIKAHGSQTLEQAVMNGCKVAASEMSSQMGKEIFYSYLEKFGFGQKTGIDFPTDTAGDIMKMKYASPADIAKMGAGENMKISQMQLLNAVTAIINDGVLYEPRLVLGLADAQGNIVESYTTIEKGQTVQESVTTAFKTAMQEAVQTGAAQPAQIIGYTSGALFGTTLKYDSTGALVQGKEISTFITFAPADDPKYIVLITLNGIDQSDANQTAAAPYAKSVLEEILKYANIRPDDEEVRTEEKIEVPNVVDMALQTAIDTLAEKGINHVADGTGTVTSQTPAARELVFKNTVVSLEMDSKSPMNAQGTVEMVTVPDFAGMAFEQARDLAISTGLDFFAQGKGVAQKQYPVFGTNVPKGSSVTVTFKLQLPTQ